MGSLDTYVYLRRNAFIFYVCFCKELYVLIFLQYLFVIAIERKPNSKKICKTWHDYCTAEDIS